MPAISQSCAELAALCADLDRDGLTGPDLAIYLERLTCVDLVPVPKAWSEPAPISAVVGSIAIPMSGVVLWN